MYCINHFEPQSLEADPEPGSDKATRLLSIDVSNNNDSHFFVCRLKRGLCGSIESKRDRQAPAKFVEYAGRKSQQAPPKLQKKRSRANQCKKASVKNRTKCEDQASKRHDDVKKPKLKRKRGWEEEERSLPNKTRELAPPPPSPPTQRPQRQKLGVLKHSVSQHGGCGSAKRFLAFQAKTISKHDQLDRFEVLPRSQHLQAYGASGRGLGAKISIQQGQAVIEYGGDLKDAAAAEAALESQVDGNAFFLYQLTDDLFLDATCEKDEFGLARLINHSSIKPNLFPRVFGGKLFFFALREIRAGEELLYHYHCGGVGNNDPWMLPGGS